MIDDTQGVWVGWLRALALGVALCSPAMAGCHQHVRLEFPDTSETQGQRFRCETGKTCVKEETYTPALSDKTRTQINLPRDCGGQFHEVFVEDADTSHPVVHVTCAPAQQRRLGEMN